MYKISNQVSKQKIEFLNQSRYQVLIKKFKNNKKQTFVSAFKQVTSLLSIVILLSLICSAKLSAKEGSKKLPSISYTNILDCYPQFKNDKLAFDVDLEILKKSVDQAYPSLKSLMRYRKVIYDDLESSENTQIQKKRMTLSLVHLKSVAEYRLLIEKIDDKMTGEIIPINKNHELNPSKEVIKSYLINAKIEEDETYWVDTKPNGVELSYKMSNDTISELDLSDKNKKKQLKCERRKDRGVLCLCLKK